MQITKEMRKLAHVPSQTWICTCHLEPGVLGAGFYNPHGPCDMSLVSWIGCRGVVSRFAIVSFTIVGETSPPYVRGAHGRGRRGGMWMEWMRAVGVLLGCWGGVEGAKGLKALLLLPATGGHGGDVLQV